MILILLVPGYAQPDIDPGYCNSCHDIISRPGLIDCMVCHDAHNARIEPISSGPINMHKKHNRLGYLPRKECQQCHKPSDVIQCSDCHTPHQEQIINNISCIECHGGLPAPFGHTSQRSQLISGNHSWMQDCRVCHEGGYLKFGEVLLVPLNDSLLLCSICHSQQSKEMNSGIHGRPPDTCVDCHDPHDTRKPLGVDRSVGSPELNVSNIVNAVKKLPVLGNPIFVIVLLIIALSFVYEFMFASPEKGKILMADNIRLNTYKDHSRAMELLLKGREVETLDRVLREIDRKNVRILGMTMRTDPSRLVMFLDFSETDTTPEALLTAVNNLDEQIQSAVYSEKYEV